MHVCMTLLQHYMHCTDMLELCRLEEQANSNQELQQKLQRQQLQASSLEARLAAMQAQRDKLLMAFEGLAGTLGLYCLHALLLNPYLAVLSAAQQHSCTHSMFVL